MVRFQLRHFILSAIAVIGFAAAAGCDGGFGKGFSLPQTSVSLTAEDLIASSSLIAEIDSTSANATNASVNWLANRKSTSVYDFQLTPDASPLATTDGTWLTLAPAQSDSFLSSALDGFVYFKFPTVIAVLDTASRGSVISINPSNRETSAFEISTTAMDVTARFVGSATDSSQVSLAKPSGAKLIVSAKFDSVASSILLTLNGAVATNASTTGSPGSAASSYQILQLGPTLNTQSVTLKRLFVFSRQLTAYELGLMIQHVAKLEGMSFSLDPVLTTPTTATSDPLYTASQSVLKNKCASCHSEWIGLPASSFVSIGLVNVGAPETSPLYYRLKGSAGAGGPKNMPSTGSVSASEVAAIEAWITGL